MFMHYYVKLLLVIILKYIFNKCIRDW